MARRGLSGDVVTTPQNFALCKEPQTGRSWDTRAKEAAHVCIRITMDLGLNKAQIRTVMMEADVSGDGVIDYEEFVPIAVDLVQVTIGYYSNIEV